MSGGQVQHERMAARFARYIELRDAGVKPSDAITEIGLTYSVNEGSATKYERAYRRLRGIEHHPFSHTLPQRAGDWGGW